MMLLLSHRSGGRPIKDYITFVTPPSGTGYTRQYCSVCGKEVMLVKELPSDFYNHFASHGIDALIARTWQRYIR